MTKHRLLRNRNHATQPQPLDLSAVIAGALGVSVPDLEHLAIMQPAGSHEDDGPDLIRVGDRDCMRLGSGQLAELAAKTLADSLDGSETWINALDEWLLYHEASAAKSYRNVGLHLIVETELDQ